VILTIGSVKMHIIIIYNACCDFIQVMFNYTNDNTFDVNIQVSQYGWCDYTGIIIRMV